jgi:hypothetical protein
MRDKKDLQRLLNLNFLDLTNKTICVGRYDLPKVFCNLEEYPDYIALYSQPCDYHRTNNTAVSFYDYDIRFDNDNGLYNAIYFNNEKRLEDFRRRFKGVKYFIAPDYSQCGDVQAYHNVHRLGRAREVSIWLSLNTGAIVIPNITCCQEKDLEYNCDGLEDVDTVAVSTKGRSTDSLDRSLIQKSVDNCLLKLPNLNAIIVYSTSANSKEVDELFRNAKKKGIKIIVPDNQLRSRNIARSSHVQHR